MDGGGGGGGGVRWEFRSLLLLGPSGERRDATATGGGSPSWMNDLSFVSSESGSDSEPCGGCLCCLR